MKKLRWTIVIILILSAFGGIGLTWIASFPRSVNEANENGDGKSVEDEAEGRGGGGRPKRLAEALRDPRAAIEELEAKYRAVSIGKLIPGTPEYRVFNGDCYLLGAMDVEEADDLLANWFVRADEDEESQEIEHRGRWSPSIAALVEINRPRQVVIERILVSVQRTDNPSKLYSWETHLARKFYRDKEVLAKLDEKISSSEGVIAGRYRSLRYAIMYGSWGANGPPNSQKETK